MGHEGRFVLVLSAYASRLYDERGDASLCLDDADAERFRAAGFHVLDVPHVAEPPLHSYTDHYFELLSFCKVNTLELEFTYEGEESDDNERITLDKHGKVTRYRKGWVAIGPLGVRT
jgi:hypothetical protein